MVDGKAVSERFGLQHVPLIEERLGGNWTIACVGRSS